MKTILSLLLLVSATAANAQELVIKGSDTLGAKLVPRLAEAFKAENPDIRFSIAAEGSSTGFAALIDQTADIAMSSRRAKPTEVATASAKGLTLKPTIVGYDAIAIIVNEQNPVKALTKRQVEQIFAGDITDWAAVGGKPGKISIYTRNTSSGTYSDFKELAMRKRDYAPSTQKMAGNEQIAAEVGRNANGIGYVGLAYLKSRGVRSVSVDGSTPSVEAIRTGAYPYARPIFYYTNGEPSGMTKAFIEFTLSKKGQQITENVGFVPVE